MFEPAFTGGGDITKDLWDKIKKLSTFYKEAVALERKKLNLSPHVLRIFKPCNALCIIDQENIYFAFSDINAGGLPRKSWRDLREKGVLAPQDFHAIAVQQAGIENPIIISFKLAIIDNPEEDQREAVAMVASQYVNETIKAITRPPVPPGYEYLEMSLTKFLKDHPDVDKNVFIGMRFQTDKHFKEIHKSIVASLGKHGLIGLRADDKVYPSDDDLWDNVCTYMLGCKYGIFVFEDIDEREFNPNIPLEYGFMRCQNKRLLILKEKRLPSMPTDIIGKLYKPFDIFNISNSIDEQITKWVKSDLS